MFWARKKCFKICSLQTPKIDKVPIFNHLGPRYHFLTTRKVISGQKYYRNAKKLKKSQFFTKFFFASETLKMVKTPILSHLGPRYRFLTTRKLISGQNYYRSTQTLKKFDFFAKNFNINLPTLAKVPKFQSAVTNSIRNFIGIGLAILENMLIFSWISLLDPTLVIPMGWLQGAQEVGRFCSFGEPDHILQVRCP